MSKEFNLDDVSELLILYEQAEELLSQDEQSAIAKSEELFESYKKELLIKRGGLIDENESNFLYEKVLGEMPEAKDALKKKFLKANELLRLSQIKKSTNH